MPMDYLQSIEYLQLPFRAVDERALQCVRALAAAGLVDARFVVSNESGGDSAADIRAITDQGRAALAHFAQGKPFR